MATYTIGFAESLLDLLADVVPTWDGIVVPISECAVAGCRDNDVRIIAAPCLLLFLVIAFAGMDWVTRIQKALLVRQSVWQKIIIIRLDLHFHFNLFF